MCFFKDFKIYSGLWLLSVSPPCQCVYVHNGRSITSAVAELAEFRKITIFWGKTQYLMSTLYLTPFVVPFFRPLTEFGSHWWKLVNYPFNWIYMLTEFLFLKVLLCSLLRQFLFQKKKPWNQTQRIKTLNMNNIHYTIFMYATNKKLNNRKKCHQNRCYPCNKFKK